MFIILHKRWQEWRERGRMKRGIKAEVSGMKYVNIDWRGSDNGASALLSAFILFYEEG